MRVMSQSPDPLARMHIMTKRRGNSGTIDLKALVTEDEEFLRAMVRTALQEVLEAEMTEALSAEKSERTAGRRGYRSGYYGRTVITRSASWSCACRRTARRRHCGYNVFPGERPVVWPLILGTAAASAGDR
jgi:hypothetical protein